MRGWLKVLIVSDNRARSQDLAQFINQTGAEPHLCSSIGEAQRILQGHPICMVFSDHTFPDGGFRDIMAILASLGTRIPVAVYSPSQWVDEEYGDSPGGDVPYIFFSLFDEVERLIEGLVVPGPGLTN